MDAILESTVAPFPRTSAARWGGRLLVGLAALFLAFDGLMKVVHVAAVTEASVRLGLPDGANPGIGLLELACLALYLVPRSAPLGAVLLTGFLGGAVSLHVRVGDPLASHVLFPVYVGALLWAGLFLRDERVRRLLGSNRRASP